MDLLDDIFADGTSKPAKAGGKFQPKVKPRPVKKGPATASSVVSLTSKPTDVIAATDSTEALKTGKDSQNYCEQSSLSEEASLEHLLAAETLGPSARSNLDASTGMPDSTEDWKSEDLYIGLDSFDELLPHTSTIESSSPATNLSAVHVAGAEKRHEQLSVPVSLVDDSAPSTSNLQPDEVAAAQDPLTFQGNVVPVSGSCQMMDSYPSLEAGVLGLTATSGQSTRRFHPKSKLQVYRERHDTIIPDSDVRESVSSQLDSHSVHSEMDFIDKGKEADGGFDLEARGFDDIIISESTHGFPVHEDYVMEASHLDAGIPTENPEATSQIPEELVPQRPKTKQQKLPASDLSALGEEKGGRRSLRSRRKSGNANRLVDESEEEVIDDGEYVPEQPNDSVLNGNDDNDEDYLVGNESQGKKVEKKSNKKAEEGKRVRKSKKTESSDQAASKKPKKFAHSSRQKRRQVDKALLEAPEGAIDYQKVPIKDLIILAEHKERLAKKNPAAPQVPTTDQSTGASAYNYNEDENDASDDGWEANDDQINPGAQDTSVFLNYQTYMDKTPSRRWSTQDTELFYEAVRQFGSDFSLIEQLFPGRTRTQLKLKYKKEERQHPFRLHDALTNRSTDHSVFERVIEHLNQIEAEEMQKADNDESIDLAGEEEVEETQEINEEEPKSEHVEEVEVEAVNQDAPEMGSPDKDYESEDDWLKWSQYKSEV